jgi:hypothetical protein
MKVDESMVSASAKDFFGSNIETETTNMLGELGSTLKTAASGAPTVLDINSSEAASGMAPKASDTPIGRIKGWKERLE